jgi:hypothetical protein
VVMLRGVREVEVVLSLLATEMRRNITAKQGVFSLAHDWL